MAAAGSLLAVWPGFVWSVLPLFNMPRIKRLQALRKLEQASAVDHRGLSSADDRLATEIMDPRAESLWAEHKERQLAKLDNRETGAATIALAAV